MFSPHCMKIQWSISYGIPMNFTMIKTGPLFCRISHDNKSACNLCPLTLGCDDVTGRYYEMIHDGTLPPDMIMDLIPLCMDGVRYMLGSCRIPGLHTDTLTVATDSRHVIVVR